MLKAKDEDELIVAINTSSSSYVDEDYFKTVMGENTSDPDYLTFAVKITAIRADWIINNKKSDDGIKFLMELLRQKNQEILMTPYMKIVINFLYKKYSKQIMKSLMPPYIV